MPTDELFLPEGYRPKLNVLETELAIKLCKDTFEKELSKALNLTRVSAPLFVTPESGLNDNLSGVERPVFFDVPDAETEVEIVQSLAKWKRLALMKYGFPVNTGLYTDMNAIRRDEFLDNLHSVYVDQWDWEKVLLSEHRTTDTLKDAVQNIVSAIRKTSDKLHAVYSDLSDHIVTDVTFITAQELLDRYPSLSPKAREDAICREHGTVFVIGIGGALSNGLPHDGRAPDYDDWELNGDLLVWYPLLNRAVELSSMGIRVNEESLRRQLSLAHATERERLEFHRSLLAGELPLTMGGGIGQSRLCLLMLGKAHIGEVQVSVWPPDQIEACEAHGIHLL